MFRKYHYLDHNLNPSAQTWGLYYKNKIIGFIGVLHFPHPKIKNLKRISRMVILPDYQGIGLGIQFLNKVCDFYTNKGYIVNITTSLKDFTKSLKNNSHWNLQRISRLKPENKKITDLNKSVSVNRITATLRYFK